MKVNLDLNFSTQKNPKIHVLGSSVSQTITHVRFEALLGGHFEFGRTKSRSNHQNKLRFEFFDPKQPQIHVLNSSVAQTITKIR